MSLPSRERGLKFSRRRSRSSWSAVAPLAGAWIEIADTQIYQRPICASLPSRERGLKFEQIVCMRIQKCKSTTITKRPVILYSSERFFIRPIKWPQYNNASYLVGRFHLRFARFFSRSLPERSQTCVLINILHSSDAFFTLL